MKRRIFDVFVFAGLLTASPSMAQSDTSWKELFPPKHKALILLKGGYSKDQLGTGAVSFCALGGEFRLDPAYVSQMGGYFLQMVFPAMIYYFPGKKAFTVDIKYRPELGPPVAKWIPHGFMDLGYLFSSRDWFGGSGERLNSLMLGGWFMIPTKVPDDGVVMVSGSKSIAGDQFVRFSCYTHWFFSKHFGVTIHGDNFIRKKDGYKYHHGSINAGVLLRL